jgi:hypothetical protein
MYCIGPVSYALILIYILLDDTQRMGQTRRVPESHHSTCTLKRSSLYLLLHLCILHLLYTGPVSRKAAITSLRSISVLSRAYRSYPLRPILSLATTRCRTFTSSSIMGKERVAIIGSGNWSVTLLMHDENVNC